MLKKLLAVILGIVAGGAGTFLTEELGHKMYPVPGYVDSEKPETVARYINEAPLGALLFVLLAWAVGSFLAGLTATLICNDRKSIYALCCGVVLLMLGLVNLLLIPHPFWFWVAAPFVFLVPAWAGHRAVRKRA